MQNRKMIAHMAITEDTEQDAVWSFCDRVAEKQNPSMFVNDKSETNTFISRIEHSVSSHVDNIQAGNVFPGTDFITDGFGFGAIVITFDGATVIAWTD